MLDVELLEAFMSSFFGYGRLDAELWFIGIEEGGGRTVTEILSRLAAWNARNRRPVEDVAEFHVACGMSHLFSPGAQLQPTWKGLIRTVFATNDLQPDVEQMRQYQISTFARADGGLACLELLPLPSPSVTTWNYGAEQGLPPEPWTDLPYLQRRSDYMTHILETRVKWFRQAIKEKSPRAVLFYGESYRRYWAALCGLEFPRGNYSLRREGVTQYMLLPHPCFRFPNPASIYEEAGITLRRCGVRVQ